MTLTATTVSLFCRASLALFLPTMLGANAWLSTDVRGFTQSHRVCTINREMGLPRHVCPAISLPSTSRLLATVEDEEEILEYLDEDEDDEDESGLNYDPQAALEQKAAWMDQLGKLADRTYSDPSAAVEAQVIFDEMFTAYVESDDATFFPTVEVYNKLIECLAFSRSPDGGEEAERILDRMEDASNDFVARPNEETYLTVIDAWTMRRQPDKALEVLMRTDEPSVEFYNKMIKAYSIAGDFQKAESTFQTLRDEGKANHKSWVNLMKSVRGNDIEEVLHGYMEEMELDGIEPEIGAYNVLIRAIGKQPKGQQEAVAMMYELIERYREGEELLKPNRETFRAVLSSYLDKRGRYWPTAPSVAAKVEQIMQLRESMLPKEEAETDERIYRTALGIIGRTKDWKKAVRANRIFRKYKGESLYLNYLVLNACAFTKGNAETKFEAFQVATQIYKEVRSSDTLEVSSSIAMTYLKACGELLSRGPKRDEIVKKVFQECCTLGLVDDSVLDAFEAASSEDLQLELLGGYSVDGGSIPGSWSKNVVQK